MQEKAIIVGAGTYGQVYAEYLKDEYQIIGFIDDDSCLLGTKINNIKVLGNFEYLLNQIDKNINVFVPIGDNHVRVNLLKKLIESDLSISKYFINLVLDFFNSLSSFLSTIIDLSLFIKSDKILTAILFLLSILF